MGFAYSLAPLYMNGLMYHVSAPLLFANTVLCVPTAPQFSISIKSFIFYWSVMTNSYYPITSGLFRPEVLRLRMYLKTAEITTSEVGDVVLV